MDATAVKQQLRKGMALQNGGKLLEAAQVYSEILQQAPGEADALHLLGTVEIRRNNLQNARVLIGKALERAPDNAIYHHNLAYVLGALGEGELAETHYRKAIAAKPGYAEAYFNLAGSASFAAGDPAIGGLEALLSTPKLSAADQVFAHFAAGKIYDDLGDYDRAFAHYSLGNTAKQTAPNPAYSRALIDDIIAAFDKPLLEKHRAAGRDSELPIFVVGMPRSGTSLVEQILASHPKVYGAGELPDIASIANALPEHAPGRAGYPHCLPALPSAVLTGFAEAYLRRLREMAPSALRVVDKAPLNFRHVGLIALMLPRARILHCRRHPLDTCLSCYFQNFAAGQEYSFDLAELGRFYCDYRRLMAHWSRVLPGRLVELRYEDLIADLTGTSRKLLEACGLGWDPACIDFHRTERPVRTASRWQVRQPVYRSAVGRWRNYARYLGPLRAALGPYAADSER